MLRWLVIAFLLVISIFPFYYSVLLSLRPLDQVVQNPGALWVGPSEVILDSYRTRARVAPPTAARGSSSSCATARSWRSARWR